MMTLVVLASTTGACGSRSSGATPFDRAGESGLTITIRNQRTEEARFWIWIDGRRERLGDVRSTDTVTFRHGMPEISRVRLEFDLTLGPSCMTRTVSLEPGDRLDVVLPTNLRLIDARCSR